MHPFVDVHWCVGAHALPKVYRTGVDVILPYSCQIFRCFHDPLRNIVTPIALIRMCAIGMA